jgi:hypothetical protein
MEKFTTADGKTLTYDNGVAKVWKDVEKERLKILKRLAELEDMPTDKELLIWAKDHYPYHDTNLERIKLTERLTEIDTILSS